MSKGAVQHLLAEMYLVLNDPAKAQFLTTFTKGPHKAQISCDFSSAEQ